MKKSIVAIILVVVMLFSLSACGSKPVEKAGVLVTNGIDGIEDTEYVFAVSKNSAKADFYISEINKAIKNVDLDRIVEAYVSNSRPRGKDFLDEIFVLDNVDFERINIYTTVLSPFQFSGAYGNGVDGIDMYIMAYMAEDLGMYAFFHDANYDLAYEAVKNGQGDILATAVALTDKVKADFKVSDVYLKGRLQIVSDKNEAFTKIKQLKGKRIGVLKGRQGYDIVKDAIENGALKGSGAEIVEFYTDAEAKTAIYNENVDVLVIDELAAKIIVDKQ